MDKEIYARIGSIVLFINGSVEMLAPVMLLAPTEFLPAGFQEKIIFWASLSTIYGLSRLIAG